MQFSNAQYDATVARIKKGVGGVQDRQAKIVPAAHRAMAHWYIPQQVKEAILWAAEKLTELSNWLMNKIAELMEGVGAPIVFFEAGWRWEAVKGHASTVQGAINPDVLGSSRWKGDAKDDYRNAIKPQAPAAGRIKDIANSAANGLFICAAAGLAFYLALAIIIYNFWSTLGAALAALISGVFSLPGFLAAVGDAGVTATMIWGAVGALTTCLGTQAHQMAALRGETLDNSTFPGGRWPKATT